MGDIRLIALNNWMPDVWSVFESSVAQIVVVFRDDYQCLSYLPRAYSLFSSQRTFYLHVFFSDDSSYDLKSVCEPSNFFLHFYII